MTRSRLKLVFTQTAILLFAVLAVRSSSAFPLSPVTLPALPSQTQPSRDALLQQAVDRAISGHAGAIVIVDVASGEILASNNLRLAANSLQRPGSTLKPFVLLALLESGKLDATQRLLCRRPLQIGSERMDCTHPTSVTELNADDAIAYSCNSYVAQVALRLTSGELLQIFRRAGFDSPSGFDFPKEPAQKEALGHIDRPTTQPELQLEALGNRGIEITPLELLAAYRKLAARRRNGDIGRATAIFDGLEHSVAYGMAHAAYVDGMRIAGKTGTAASRNTRGTHGFFVGYAPAEKPEIALVAFIEQGRGLDAAALAQPVFAEFARRERNK